MTGAVARQRQLVEDAGRAIVEVDVRLIVVGRRRVPVAGVVDVAEELARARRARVDVRRLAQVAQRGLELIAAAIRVAAHQIPDHRVILEGDSPAEGLDSGREVAGGHGGITALDQIPVPVFASDHDRAVSRGQRHEHERRRN